MAYRHLAECEQQISLPFDRQGLPNRAGRTFGHRAIQASAPRRTTPGSQAAGVRRVVSTYQRCLVWEIEGAFKRLKSLLNIDAIPTRTERASRSWLYAHLILALLCDDLSQEFLESSPLRTCSMRHTCRRCGAPGSSPGGCCSPPSSERSPSPTCSTPVRTSIAALPIHDESENRTSTTQ